MSVSKWWKAIQTTNIAMKIEFERFGPRQQEDERKIENVETVVIDITYSEVNVGH